MSGDLVERFWETRAAIWVNAVVLLGVALVPFALDGASGWSQVLLIILLSICVLGSFSIQTGQDRRRRRAQRARTEVEIDIRAAQRVALNDALDPVVRQVGRIATTHAADGRELLRSQTIVFVLTAATQIMGCDRARACWFSLDIGPPKAVRPQQHIGRADPPRTEFVEGTPSGDAVLAMIDQDLTPLLPGHSQGTAARLVAGRAPRVRDLRIRTCGGWYYRLRHVDRRFDHSRGPHRG